ncbi:alpha/beta hydrolase family protein [Corynebacterium sp. AOP40-9SA-29]|uniref:alpha/beta hydrolase family protein n=1 Tax=Corynebacterium sp. AOP40-9SA-29 TaxID=3457677 RepID=UPI00403455A2
MTRQQRRNRRSWHSPRALATGALSLIGTVAAASCLTACDTDGGVSAEAPPAIGAGGGTGLDVVAEVPQDEVAEGFVERIVYPVRDGEPDPEENWADLYLPDTDDAEATDGTDVAEDSVPLVVYLQGSGWNGGAHGSRHIASDLAARGMAVLNVEYRGVSEGGGWPQTFTDVADALDHVPAIDENYPQLDTDDATVVGHSAGGQLAAWAASRSRLEQDEVGADPAFSPTRVVSLAGPLDLVWAAENGDDNIVEAMEATPDELPNAYDSIDPIRNINPQVQVVAVHGTDDDLVPQENSEHYVDAVTEAGGRAELVLFDGADHLSFLQSSSRYYPRLLDIIAETAGAGAQ